MSYTEFLASKRRLPPASGIECGAADLDGRLFDFQRHITAWAIRRGRAAIWADTGLGKSRMQIAWADEITRETGGRALILAPLTITGQTVREAAAIGVTVTYVRDQAEADAVRGDGADRIVISNYERLGKFDPSRFDAVVLDESSILKSFSGATKKALVAAFRDTPYRLSCSATPAPNDLEELCNHADFLGVMSPQEMRSTFFIADSRGEFMRYRLKGHAEQAFFDWLASWAIACRTPDDLGFDGSAYVLPELVIRDHLVATGWTADGQLFPTELKGITQRSQVRRETLDQRVKTAVSLIESEPSEQWIAWCGLNDEANAIARAIDGAVNVQGSDPADVKAQRLLDFAEGHTRVLVSKPRVAGYGLNFQSCARMVFCGLSDSMQDYYQCIRRSYRFGQTRPVHAHIVLADAEEVIVRNVRAKEDMARGITSGLIAAIAAENRRDLFAGTSKGDDYEPRAPLSIPEWMTP